MVLTFFISTPPPGARQCNDNNIVSMQTWCLDADGGVTLQSVAEAGSPAVDGEMLWSCSYACSRSTSSATLGYVTQWGQGYSKLTQA